MLHFWRAVGSWISNMQRKTTWFFIPIGPHFPNFLCGSPHQTKLKLIANWCLLHCHWSQAFLIRTFQANLLCMFQDSSMSQNSSKTAFSHHHHQVGCYHHRGGLHGGEHGDWYVFCEMKYLHNSCNSYASHKLIQILYEGAGQLVQITSIKLVFKAKVAYMEVDSDMVATPLIVI